MLVDYAHRIDKDGWPTLTERYRVDRPGGLMLPGFRVVQWGPMRVAVRMSLAEWGAVTDAMVADGPVPTGRPELAAEIRYVVVAAACRRMPDAEIALLPADAAVIQALRAGLPRADGDQTARAIE